MTTIPLINMNNLKFIHFGFLGTQYFLNDHNSPYVPLVQ